MPSRNGSFTIKGIVRRRRAYRVLQDEEGEDVRDEKGELEYTFDFQIWPNRTGDGTVFGGKLLKMQTLLAHIPTKIPSIGPIPEDGFAPIPKSNISSLENVPQCCARVHVFMRNRMADRCQTIKPTDKVMITGTGINLKCSPDKDDDDVDIVAFVEEPCTLRILRSVSHKAKNDISTQAVYDTSADIIHFRRRGTRPSPSRTIPPKPSPPIAKRPRRHSVSTSSK